MPNTYTPPADGHNDREVFFFPVNGSPSALQLLGLCRNLWPHVPLSEIRFAPGVNCFTVGPGAAAADTLVPELPAA